MEQLEECVYTYDGCSCIRSLIARVHQYPLRDILGIGVIFMSLTVNTGSYV